MPRQASLKFKHNVGTKFLPYSLPSIGEEEIAEIADNLRNGWLSIGPKVKRFEEEFARYVGAKHAIAVNSCTSALALALAALDVSPGDEVIVPTMTFCATANVVEHRGATPILVDIGPDLQINPDAVQKAISKATRAIIPVHYAGQACQLHRLEEIAKSHGVPLIHDAAHAVGAKHAGRPIGSYGLVTAFSFYPSKNMTTGEGGMLTTNDRELAARLRRLARHGIHRGEAAAADGSRSWDYDVCEPGYKAAMPDLFAAIGLQQLRKLDGFIARRREIAQRYSTAFSQIPGLLIPGDFPDRLHTYHLYPLRIKKQAAELNRDQLIDQLFRSGIGTSVHYIPLHQHSFYRRQYGTLKRSFPLADTVASELVCLPLYPAMSDDDVARVVQAVVAALSGKPTIRLRRAGSRN